jgi:hypothetical protein
VHLKPCPHLYQISVSVSRLDTRSWYSRLMTRQPDMYHVSVSSKRIFQFSTHQSCIISWVPVVTMSLQLQLPAASYIFIHYALKNESRRSRRWWMKTVFVNRGSHGRSSLLRDLKLHDSIGLPMSFFFNRLKWCGSFGSHKTVFCWK